MANLPFDEGIFRQRERTVDNIKRIYAVVYSLSTFILKEIFDYVKDYIILKSSVITPEIHDAFVHGVALRCVMIVVFVSTVAVFSYQADKFLDLRYTLRPPGVGTDMAHVTRIAFAMDAISLIFTLVPFIFMAYAFTKSIVDIFGTIPFFMSYLLLLCLAIAFLILVHLPNVFVASKRGAAVPGVLGEKERYEVLTVNWFLTNGLAISILTGAYMVTRGTGALCGAASFTNQAVFASIFAFVALLRSLYDFYSAWPFLYMNKRDPCPAEMTWLMSLYLKSERRSRVGILAISGILSLASVIWALVKVFPDINPDTC